MKTILTATGNCGRTRALKAVRLLWGAALLAGMFLGLSAPSAHAANSVSISTTPPTTNVTASYEPTGRTGIAIRRYSGSGSANTRATGQSFQCGTAFNISAITVQAFAENQYDTLTPHVIEMAIMDDTNADGTPDTQVGTPGLFELFDMAGLHVLVGDYVTFTLGTPSPTLQANHTYGFNFWWTTNDALHNLQIYRSDASGTYALGGYLTNTTRVFPITSAPNGTDDCQFYIQSAPLANQAPSFTADPFTKPDATVGVPYSQSIATDASDPDGDPLTFAKEDGPPWLSVAGSGALTGTPGGGDVGLNAFIVRATDPGDLLDTATLNITVGTVSRAHRWTPY